ncbi:MAG TPA: YihY/virulence factor BrkB family protein [Acidimicrobiia bacterium]|nr:YihY/virulence factor BrkB family protein [Acidimicrobiia bacterium]
MAAGLRERLSLRRWRPTRLALDVQDRYGELHGGEMASAITLSAFLSLLPLLLVGIAVLGFFSAASSKDLAQQVVDQLQLAKSSDTARLITEAMHTAETSRKAASVVGLAGLLWTGLGVVNSLQYVWNTAWQVPGRGLRDKAIGLGWLAGAAVLFVASFALSAASQLLPWYLQPLGILTGLATGVGLWLWTARALPNRQIGWRALLPGALVGAVGFEVLKVLASFVVPRMVASSSDLYGPVGVVFAVLGWLLLFGRLVVYAAVVEVVLWEQRHGTVRLAIEAPARPGVAPVGATRAGEQRFSRPEGRPGFPMPWRKRPNAPAPADPEADGGNGDRVVVSGRRSGQPKRH